MTMQKRLTQTSDLSRLSNLGDRETLITSPLNRDWDSLMGLLLMVGLTGLAADSLPEEIGELV